MANQGGSHEQHVKAGQQSHKNQQQQASGSRMDDRDNKKSTQGGSSEQHGKSGQQGQKKNH